jgi:hypothetical protein
MAVGGLPDTGTGLDGVKEPRKLRLDGMLEAPHPRVRQVTDDLHGLLGVAVQEVAYHQHAVVDLPFEFDLLSVGEHVVEQAGVVGRGVLHRLQRARSGHLRRQRHVARQPGQAHREP